MPCRFASSGTVATSRSASSAILALNAASNFLRDLVISVLHRLRQSRTLHTLTFGPISGVHFTLLAQDPSATLRKQLITEIGNLESGDDLALWAHRRLPAKNTLVADDARAVEAAYQAVLDAADQQPLPDETQRDDRDQAAQSPHAGGPKVQASYANGTPLTDATE